MTKLSTTTAYPIGFDGSYLSVSDIGDEEDPVEALLPDNRLVTIVEVTEVNSYPSRTTLWCFKSDSVIQMPAGLYEAMQGFWVAYRAELDHRKKEGRGTVRFQRFTPFIGYRVFRDVEFAQELIQRGWAEILADC